jgi:hypothetical protein
MFLDLTFARSDALPADGLDIPDLLNGDFPLKIQIGEGGMVDERGRQ